MHGFVFLTRGRDNFPASFFMLATNHASALATPWKHGLIWFYGGQKGPDQPLIKISASVTAVTSINTPFLHTAVKE
jgi:hypothetical protein